MIIIIVDSLFLRVHPLLVDQLVCPFGDQHSFDQSIRYYIPVGSELHLKIYHNIIHIIIIISFPDWLFSIIIAILSCMGSVLIYLYYIVNEMRNNVIPLFLTRLVNLCVERM